MQLTAAQRQFFETFGYLALPGCLTAVIEDISAAFEAVWAAHGGGHDGKPHAGQARSCIVPFIDQHERLCALLDDPHIHGALVDLLGPTFNYVGSDGNFYVGDTPWHADGAHPKEVLFVKVAFYLDPVARDSGCLRVIPGSHLDTAYAKELKAHIGSAAADWGVGPRDLPAIALATRPGDVLIFNHNLLHASFGGSDRRRMFTINACRRHTDDQLPSLIDYIAAHARFCIDRLYGETMCRTASPQRQVHLEQVRANDGHLAALAAAYRTKASEPARG